MKPKGTVLDSPTENPTLSKFEGVVITGGCVIMGGAGVVVVAAVVEEVCVVVVACVVVCGGLPVDVVVVSEKIEYIYELLNMLL